MKIIYALLLLFFTSHSLFSQNKNIDFSGIWRHSEDENSFIIVKNNYVLDLYCENKDEGCLSGDCYFYCSFEKLFFLKEYYGLNKRIEFGNLLTINPNESCGVLTFLTANQYINKREKIVESEYDLYGIGTMSTYSLTPGESLELSNSKVHNYWFLKSLPKGALIMLYQKGQTDNIDYIKLFLNIDIRAIERDNSILYDSMATKTNVLLRKNDIVTVIGMTDKFSMVEYEFADGKISKGLILKEALAIKQDKREVSVSKTYIYSAPNIITQQYLIEGDIVDIINENGDFFQVEYTTIGGDVIKGFIKKADVGLLDKEITTIVAG